MSPEQIDLAQWQAWRQTGNHDAFRSICIRYAPVVYHAGLRILQNPVDAEDIVQESFAALANAPAPPRFFGPWLHGVATKQALQRRRGDSRRREREARFADQDTPAAEPTWDDVSDFIDDAIAQLPSKYRVPLELHYLEGRSHKEIATALKVSRQTVTYRIQKALERTRAVIRRHGVGTSLVALSTLMAENLAQAAVPAAVAGSLSAIAPVAATGASTLRWLWSVAAAHKAAVGVISIAAVSALALLITMQVPPPTPDSAKTQVANGTNAPHAPETTSTYGLADATTPRANETVTAEPLTANTQFPSGTIGGRVMSLEGQGVEGQRIRFDKLYAQEPAVYATSGEDGAYVSPPLAPGGYNVSLEPQPPYHQIENEASRLQETKVAAKQQIRDRDFLVRSGRLISGHVVLHDGAPAGGAWIRVEARRHLAHTDADESGNFSIAVPEPGRSVEIRANHTDRKYGAASFTLGPLDIPEHGLSGIELKAYRPSKVRGVLLNEFGGLEAGLQIEGHLVESRYAPDEPYVDDLIGVGRTESDGSFELYVPLPGRMQISVRPGDYNEERIFVDEMTIDPGKEYNGMHWRLPPDSTPYRPTPEPVNRFTHRGQIVDTAGNPIPDVRVAAGAIDERDLPLYMEEVTTGKDGFFSIPVPFDAPAQLAITHDAYNRKILKEIVPDGSLQKFALIHKGTLTIRVIDFETQLPVEQFGTSIQKDYSTRTRAITPEIIQSHVLNFNRPPMKIHPNGVLEEENVSAGNIQVAIYAEGYAPAVQIAEMPESDEAHGEITIGLEHGIVLQGRVLSPDGRPLPFASVGLTNTDNPANNPSDVTRISGKTTDENGRFEFDMLVPMKGLEVIAAHADFAYASVVVDVQDNMMPIELTLRPVGRIDGHVTSAFGVVERAFVSVEAEDSNVALANSEVWRDGSYTLEGVPPGPVRVYIYYENNEKNGSTLLKRAIVAADKTTTLDFTLPAADGSLSGTVTIDGAPLFAGIWIWSSKRPMD